MAESDKSNKTPFVLVVDDDSTVLFLAKQYLTKTGFRVETAENGRMALSAIELKKPDIILLDVMMPEMDGFETCSKIREIPATQYTPVLMITGLDDFESIQQAYEAGGTDFFTKPINWLILEHRIRYMLRLSRTEEELRKAQEELEQRVEERTHELQKTNQELQEEIQNREQIEETLRKAFDELKSTQAQLVQSAKLASIGELAAGVVHELNQPLMVIRGYTQTLLRHPSDGDNVEKWLRLIEKNTGRMTNIINHLRVFSRQSESEFMPVDLNRIIEDAFLMVGEQLRLREITTIKSLSKELPNVKGDPNKLEQVVLNLITNARDAIDFKSDSGCLVDSSDQHAPEARLEIATRMPEDRDGHVELIVCDSGCGIPEDKLDKIFDPFFTTKEVGKGTGLGLSISYGIIKEHDADIEVADTGSQGTTFKIRFPVANP